ncbi:MAG: hypothetical protein P8L18_13000 [Verrucomicrobiota bacterium]|nr:hypothetical protein [Verrucomicrobiota bacterium]
MIPPRQQTRQGGLGLVRDIIHHLRARGMQLKPIKPVEREAGDLRAVQPPDQRSPALCPRSTRLPTKLIAV